MRDGTTAAIVVVGLVFICGLVLIMGSLNERVLNHVPFPYRSKDDLPCVQVSTSRDVKTWEPSKIMTPN